MEDKLLTLTEVSAYLKIPKSTLYKLVEKKEMPSCKIGKQLRFRKSSLDSWLSDKENKLTPPETPPKPKAKQLLLIEDDELVSKAIARLLKTHGYTLEVAYSGEEALEKVKNLKLAFDLIITDIRMPGIDGIETLKRIREFYQALSRPHPAEIIITGYTDGKPEQEAQELGISDYLYKPFVTTDFMRTIEKRLGVGENLFLNS